MDARTLIAQQIAACPPLRLSVRLQTPAAARPCKLRVRRRSASAADGDDLAPAGASADGDAAGAAEPVAAAPADGSMDQEAGEPPAAAAAAAGACSAESLHIVAVLDHLMHTCCWKTAAKLSAALLERAAAARSVAEGDGAGAAEPERPVWEALAASLVKEEAHAEIQQRKEALELVINGRVGEVRSVAPSCLFIHPLIPRRVVRKNQHAAATGGMQGRRLQNDGFCPSWGSTFSQISHWEICPPRAQAIGACACTTPGWYVSHRLAAECC